MKPFRWDISRKEQLGRLIEGDRSPAYKGFRDDLRVCCARLMAFSNNGYLVFVGRSPESVFDYLSGAFEGMRKADELVHLNISNRYVSVQQIGELNAESVEALADHFRKCALSPEDIVSRKSRTLFTDLVAYGGTFGHIATFLFSWARKANVPVKELRAKLGFLGITSRSKTSPKTWRWQQNVDWVKTLRVGNIKNVSITVQWWDYLGNWQMKVSATNRPGDWASDAILEPPRMESNVRALRRAFDLYSSGSREKERFSELLSQESAVEEEWFRRLISELRLGVR